METFRADEEGLYEGQSTQFSGTSFPAMRAWVRVVSQEEYEQYVADLGENLAAAQQAVVEEAAQEAEAEAEASGAESSGTEASGTEEVAE